MVTDLIIGNPVPPMLVQESGNDNTRFDKILKAHSGESIVQIKSDGYRVQVHNTGEELSLYTRTLHDLNPQVYPDIISQLEGLPVGIFDGELVGVEDGIRGFKAVKKRVRSTLHPELVEKHPLKINFFDCLNLEGTTIIDQSLTERRQILENTVDSLSKQWIVNNTQDLKSRYNHTTEILELEGLVCKNPLSAYQIGKRNKDWMKLKKFINLDLVVLGVYQGEGKASKLPFAGLLLGTQNGNQYETITKVGIAKKDIIEQIYQKVKNNYQDTIPDNVIINEAINKKQYARKVPFKYIQPQRSAIVEVDAMNVTRSKNWHSCGYEDNKAFSLRIPIVQRYRDDKRLEDIATTSLIKDLYVE